VGNLVVALVLVLIATGISALLPAIRATQVSPLRAMQTED
jgi:ABC-type antimicrobial peptide transport system permease subunit